jgi:hypothetical protein
MLQIAVFPPPIRDGGTISGLCIKGDRISKDKNLIGEKLVGQSMRVEILPGHSVGGRSVKALGINCVLNCARNYPGLQGGDNLLSNYAHARVNGTGQCNKS